MEKRLFVVQVMAWELGQVPVPPDRVQLPLVGVRLLERQKCLGVLGPWIYGRREYDWCVVAS